MTIMASRTGDLVIDPKCRSTVTKLKSYKKYVDSKKSSESSTKLSKPRQEKYRLVTKDLVRDIVVPNDEPKLYPGIISQETYDRLKKEAVVVDHAAEHARIDAARADYIRRLEESSKYKEELLEIDRSREQDPSLDELELQAKRQAQYVIARARDLQLENEEDMKKANNLIMRTKCQAIRDAQIAEKKLIKSEMAEEEKRLREMMEQERQMALAKEKRKREEAEKKRKEITQHTLAEMARHELKHLVDAEKGYQEGKLARKALYEKLLGTLEEDNQQKERQKLLRDDMKKDFENFFKQRQMAKEAQKLADMKIMEYQRQKAAAEEAREAEEKRMRHERELANARILAEQEREVDRVSEQQGLKARRIQEEAERNWRKKEQEDATIAAKKSQQLKVDRETQLRVHREGIAMQVKKDRQDYNRIVEALKAAEELQRKKDEEKRCEKLKFREKILKQMKEKEAALAAERQKLFEEGVAANVEKQKHERSMKEALKQKLKELRANNVPDRYIKEIERQLKLSENNPE